MLIFTQFADTERYLTAQLAARGVAGVAGVSGDSENPTTTWSTASARRATKQDDLIGSLRELRALVTTDVLSEGQNLQDCSIVVNYDLPWAIIRLIQRAGRVDRIGQQAERILCYSFLPAEGVERIIRLRSRVRARLTANAQVVGADEAFFEGDQSDQPLLDLYSEKAGILDGDDAGGEEDLASQAYEIWKQAILANPALEKEDRGAAVRRLLRARSSYRAGRPGGRAGLRPHGRWRRCAGACGRAGADRDAVAAQDSAGGGVRADYASRGARANHHELTRAAIAHLAAEERSVGGGLGRPSGARYKVYTRLSAVRERAQGDAVGRP